MKSLYKSQEKVIKLFEIIVALYLILNTNQNMEKV